MVEILVLEDDYLWQLHLERILQKYKNFKILKFSETIKDGLVQISNLNPDLIISDIYLKDGNVFDSLLQHKFEVTPTLFISGTQEELVLGRSDNYKMSSYLVKPFHEVSLISTLNILADNYINLKNNYIFLKSNQKAPQRIYFEEIERVEAEGNYCIIFFNNGKKIAKKLSLKKMITTLDKRFFQINKSTLVNLNHLSKIDYSNHELYINNLKFPLGKKYKKNLESILY
ncbi:LytR/AlgR family response regulator transcription factor [Lacihabitans lacunae]|uniref:LytR/AlgR family response regulator transcription factor n=1 Tax=Lacihabitans lacunae TaxID=1028214 RepID=A0ABV7Z570_9BACT